MVTSKLYKSRTIQFSDVFLPQTGGNLQNRRSTKKAECDAEEETMLIKEYERAKNGEKIPKPGQCPSAEVAHMTGIKHNL